MCLSGAYLLCYHACHRDKRGGEAMASEGASAIGHASSWGYACFLTVNATSVWGGIFPFLPLEFQTVEVTLTFFLTQAVAFGGAFLASMLGSYFFPYGARRMLVSLSAVLLFLGSACLITAMYVASATIAFCGRRRVCFSVSGARACSCSGSGISLRLMREPAISALSWARLLRPSFTSRCI